MQSLCILGRQPVLGLAELESLYGAGKVRAAGEQAAVVEVDPCLLAFERLGGSIKFCKVLTTLQAIDWREIEKFLIKVSPEHSRAMPAGKMHLGLSTYGFKIAPAQIGATALSVKKAIQKATGRSVRVAPNKEAELSSAQVIHNKLTGSTGWELILVRDGDATIVAQSVKVQNLESYTLRDRGRPKRDARVGMLPPKLAQIIINLAVSQLPEDKLESICEIPAGSQIPQPKFDQTILDPFCGTGVILQEATLMGYEAYGSDMEQRLVDYSQQNLDWLNAQFPNLKPQIRVEAGDATHYQWAVAPDFVASETYLGRPFTSQPNSEILAQTASECNIIIKKFLQNIHSQIKPGTRLCLAVPAWQVNSGQFKHLPVVDSLGEIGYNRVKFEHVRSADLLYYRPDQIVARQLLVIIRK
jgi:SAM-dependent methyltransferase